MRYAPAIRYSVCMPQVKHTLGVVLCLLHACLYNRLIHLVVVVVPAVIVNHLEVPIHVAHLALEVIKRSDVVTWCDV